MPVAHIEFLVEELSMEAFLRALLPRMLPEGLTFNINVFQGKSDLLSNLRNRLRGYASWLPPDWRIVIIIDRDGEDCIDLKAILEGHCVQAGISTRARNPPAWNAATCIAIEELEAWYFGDWQAVVESHPRVASSIPAKAAYRIPDAIAGGTWEALERVLQRGGYYSGGLQKVTAARLVGACLDPAR